MKKNGKTTKHGLFKLTLNKSYFTLYLGALAAVPSTLIQTEQFSVPFLT